ncbi:MAG: 3-hydroxybutyryl-CoA dehydrogenase [Gemmatimonadaceae bacterium]|nr:3-hydroxybutyryl-CoA dehydrogenase [Gemmatimonadaceae bacterium]
MASDAVVGVVGAGAMGAGIAQVAAQRGHRVLLADAVPAAVERARDGHARAFAREVEKGRMKATDAEAALARLVYVPGVAPAQLAEFAPCALVIEAVVEDLAAKRRLFHDLETVVAPTAILATNTSSLSIAAIAGACAHPGRVVGLHFFNPAPVMPLVEVIPAIATDPAVTAAARALAEHWLKVVVVATDTPGFIVNRVARPFYGEALRIVEERLATPATVDWAMTALGGFRMGPFELMDLIGNDVNFAVTLSVYEGMFQDPRYRPSLIQQRLVAAGLLGRKSGRGHYDHRPGAVRPEPLTHHATGQQVVDRILAMLVNEAVEAVRLGIATPHDVELAMQRGVNYPRGLLAWGDAIGPRTILDRLETLQAEYGEDRYRPSPLLRRIVRDGGTLAP